MLRLQSFPHDWKVDGDYRQQVRQVGNATPPLLAEVVGRAVLSKIICVDVPAPKPMYQVDRVASVPLPEAIGDVPQQFERLEGVHADHPGPGRGPKPLVVDRNR